MEGVDERPEHFDTRQHKEALRAYDVAEDLTGDHFALDAIGSLRHLVDLRTLIDLSVDEFVPHGAFAQVARYEEVGSLASKARTLYRVCVQDHAILERLRAERGAVGFFPLLAYVLTHELVHIVRFTRHQGRFFASEHERRTEEAIVHEITQRVLSRAPLPSLRPVLERFGNLGLASLRDASEARDRLAP